MKKVLALVVITLCLLSCAVSFSKTEKRELRDGMHQYYRMQIP